VATLSSSNKFRRKIFHALERKAEEAFLSLPLIMRKAEEAFLY